jgi:hypothetical protein
VRCPRAWKVGRIAEGGRIESAVLLDWDGMRAIMETIPQAISAASQSYLLGYQGVRK